MPTHKTLVLDIETVGEDYDALNEATKDNLTRWLKKESWSEEEYQTQLKDIKESLGFSPLTGQIVAIGVLDYHSQQGVVYFQAPGQNLQPFEENKIQYKPMTEKDMLLHFWKGAEQYQEFITFNGRGFDAPFLMVRSAVHGLRPSKDLMSNRYRGSQKWGSIHIDLLDQLSFYGAVRRKGSLHLWSRAFGIESPKASGVTGDDVARLFAEKKYTDIARYNVGDLYATAKLYDYWDRYLKFE